MRRRTGRAANRWRRRRLSLRRPMDIPPASAVDDVVDIVDIVVKKKKKHTDAAVIDGVDIVGPLERDGL